VGLWETLTSALRRVRIRLGDEAWAAVQPMISKLHAGTRRFTQWRGHRADALSYAGASLRASWRGASGRRRATVGVLAVLPIAMASGVTAMLLPAGGDPQAGPAHERTASDAPSKQKDANAPTAGPRATRYERAAQATGGADAASAAQDVAVAPDPAAASEGSRLAGGRRAGDGSGAGSRDGGGGGDSGDSPAHGDDRSDAVERRTSAAPAPPTRAHTRRVPAGGGGERFGPSPGPPAAKPPAPQAQAPAVAPAPAAPPVTETAPQETPAEADVEEDSDSNEGGGSGQSDRRGPPPDHGGGNDKDEDVEEDKDP
jgi:hypothetical protein